MAQETPGTVEAAKEPQTFAEQFKEFVEYGQVQETEEAEKPPEPAASVPEPKPTPTPEPEPKTFTHSRVVSRRAMELGAKPHEIAATSPEQLDAWIEWKEQEAKSATPAQVEKVPAPEEPDLDLGLDENEFSPAHIAAMKKIAEFSKTKTSKLEKELADLRAKEAAREKQIAERSQMEGFQRIEDAFASLPKKFQKIVGEGYLSEITDQAARKKAEARRGAIMAKAGLSFNNVPPERVVQRFLAKAAEELYEEFLDSEAPAPPSKEHPTSEDWEGAGLKVPSDPPPSLPIGRQAFLKAARAKLAQMNQAQ